MLVRTLSLALAAVLFILLLIPLLVVCFLVRWRAPIMAAGKTAIRLALFLAGIEVEVSGKDKVRKDVSYIFMANHLSFIDGPLLFLLIPRPVRVILKKEAFRIPVIGQTMRFAQFVPVDRKGIRAGKKSIDRAVSMIKEKGYSFLIFPEGTRSRDGRLQPFRRGGFFLAHESGVPILPVTIRGTFALMPKGSLLVGKGRVQVRFHPAIPPVRGDRDAVLSGLMERVRNAVASGLDEEGRN